MSPRSADTAFMYVLAVLMMVKIYQSRHPDINARAHSTFGVLAVLIALGKRYSIASSVLPFLSVHPSNYKKLNPTFLTNHFLRRIPKHMRRGLLGFFYLTKLGVDYNQWSNTVYTKTLKLYKFYCPGRLAISNTHHYTH